MANKNLTQAKCAKNDAVEVPLGDNLGEHVHEAGNFRDDSFDITDSFVAWAGAGF